MSWLYHTLLSLSWMIIAPKHLKPDGAKSSESSRNKGRNRGGLRIGISGPLINSSLMRPILWRSLPVLLFLSSFFIFSVNCNNYAFSETCYQLFFKATPESNPGKVIVVSSISFNDTPSIQLGTYSFLDAGVQFYNIRYGGGIYKWVNDREWTIFVPFTQSYFVRDKKDVKGIEVSDYTHSALIAAKSGCSTPPDSCNNDDFYSDGACDSCDIAADDHDKDCISLKLNLGKPDENDCSRL